MLVRCLKLRFIEMAVKFLFTASPQVDLADSDHNPSVEGLSRWVDMSDEAWVHVTYVRYLYVGATVNTEASAAAAATASTTTAGPAMAADAAAVTETLLYDWLACEHVHFVHSCPCDRICASAYSIEILSCMHICANTIYLASKHIGHIYPTRV